MVGHVRELGNLRGRRGNGEGERERSWQIVRGNSSREMGEFAWTAE